jgi:NAD(P)-dependent dehydrogenase (short-subunit alcohol dehydrogenase family)
LNWPEQLIFIPNGQKPVQKTDARLDGKICVITGATSGVGYQAAKRLAEGGASILIVCRNPEKGETVANELKQEYDTESQVILADFSNLDQVRSAAQAILDSGTNIDVLINNAGIHRTTRTLTPEGHEIVFCVNHLASFLFTRLLLERMLENSPARILQINSQGHRFGGLDIDDLTWAKRRYRGIQGYGASKVAQLLTVWEFAEKLAGQGVTINAMHPGEVRTNIGMDNGPLYRFYQNVLLRPILQAPEISGEAIYYLAAAPEMETVTGRFFNKTTEENPTTFALDRVMGKKIWERSEKLIGLSSLDLAK